MSHTRVLMLESHDRLNKGEYLNLPAGLAIALIRAGKAQAGQATTAGGPSETKVVIPKETKAKGVK